MAAGGANPLTLPFVIDGERGHVADAAGVWVVPESIEGLRDYSAECLLAYLDHLSSGQTNADWNDLARSRGWVCYRAILSQWSRHPMVNTALVSAQQFRLVALEDECLVVSRHREVGSQDHEAMETAANQDGTMMEGVPVVVKRIKKRQDDSPNSRRVHLTGVLKAVEAAKTSAALFVIRNASRALLNDGDDVDDQFKRQTRRAVAQLALEIAGSTMDTRERIVAGTLALKAIGVEPEGDKIDILAYTHDTSGDNPDTSEPED